MRLGGGRLLRDADGFYPGQIASQTLHVVDLAMLARRDLEAHVAQLGAELIRKTGELGRSF